MVYRKAQNKTGDYRDINEVRYDVFEANEAWTPQGKNVGWDEFADMQTAVNAYGLIYDPLPKLDNIE
jgi:hypothetical protein